MPLFVVKWKPISFSGKDIDTKLLNPKTFSVQQNYDREITWFTLISSLLFVYRSHSRTYVFWSHLRVLSFLIPATQWCFVLNRMKISYCQCPIKLTKKNKRSTFPWWQDVWKGNLFIIFINMFYLGLFLYPFSYHWVHLSTRCTFLMSFFVKIFHENVFKIYNKTEFENLAVSLQLRVVIWGFVSLFFRKCSKISLV